MTIANPAPDWFPVPRCFVREQDTDARGPWINSLWTEFTDRRKRVRADDGDEMRENAWTALDPAENGDDHCFALALIDDVVLLDDRLRPRPLADQLRLNLARQLELDDTELTLEDGRTGPAAFVSVVVSADRGHLPALARGSCFVFRTSRRRHCIERLGIDGLHHGVAAAIGATRPRLLVDHPVLYASLVRLTARR